MSGRLAGDRGQVGGIEVLPFGVLTFVAVTLLIANGWGVIDAKLAVTAAAREGARAFAEASDVVAAERSATTRARDTLSGYGRDGDRATVEIVTIGAPFGRCTRFRVTVRYSVPLVDLPFLGSVGRAAPVASSFTEVVDPFRDGLAGPASC